MKVVTFGEVMLRLSPPGHNRFLQSNEFVSYFGGSEFNTAIALRSLGIPTSFVSKLPDNDIAAACIKELKGNEIDVSSICIGGDRLGIYYCENGAGIRGGKVIYDRANSSFSKSKNNDYNWDNILKGADVFHFTGITTALNDSVAAIALDAVKNAKQRGIKVSCDLNYRRTLWSREKANSVMSEFMPYVDILIANSGSALDVFGLDGSSDEDVLSKLANQFGNSIVAFTTRECKSANDNTLGGILYYGNKFYHSDNIQVNIVDRVGGGDCFDAGILYGILSDMSPELIVNFANACNAYKHTIHGDYCRLNKEEILDICSGSFDGRIKR